MTTRQQMSSVKIRKYADSTDSKYTTKPTAVTFYAAVANAVTYISPSRHFSLPRVLRGSVAVSSLN